MTTEPQRVRVSPTTREILQRQAAEAERNRAPKAPAAAPPAATAPATAPGAPVTGTAVAPTTSTAVAVPDSRTPQQQYLDEIAPAAIVGRLAKFGKDGKFVTADDGEEISEDADFIVLADQTLIGWLRFYNDGWPPSRAMGLLYDGFKMPKREELGDLDQADWPLGLSGLPEDVWRHHIYLVLQHADTAELLTFATSSMTGRRAVGNLLRHYDRMRRTHPDELPVVKLKVGGFQHKDERIGWVATPTFAVVGRAPRDSVAKPDTTTQGQLNDTIPF
jgi:hypothetical protein